MKEILVLGSTGSVGSKTLEVIRSFPNLFKVVGLAACRSSEKLVQQAWELGVKHVSILDPSHYDFVQGELPRAKVYSGGLGLFELIKKTEFDLAVNAIAGFAGFLPSIEIIKRGKDIALANKETIVIGGQIIMAMAANNGVNIIPIDSEHSAIFHLLRGVRRKDVYQLIITASGGPFWGIKINHPSIGQVLNHPVWDMGKKITVDSATLANKGMEVIEAHHLFNVPYDQIKVLIHPQAIVHSLVESVSGEVYAQIGPRDMRLPIQNALTYPQVESTPFERLNLTMAGALTFFEPDLRQFPFLELAYTCGKAGGVLPAVMNAANEIAVHAFLQGQIEFEDIYRIVAKVVWGSSNVPNATFTDIVGFDKLARISANKFIKKM